MENRPVDGPTAPMSPVEKASVFEDFIDIFHAPASVFARREKGGFGLMLLLVSVIAAVFAFSNRGVMSQIFDAEYDRRIAKVVAENPQVPADQMAAIKPMQIKIQTASTYVVTPLWIFFVAFIVWLTGLVFKTRVSYGQAVLIVTLSFVPRQLAALGMTLQVVFTDTSAVTSPYALGVSPARFLNSDTMNANLYAFLGTLDAFRIWAAVLQGIGVAVMAKVDRAKGYLVTGIVFLFFSLVLAALG